MHTVRDAICAWDTRITDGCLTQTGVGTLLKHSQHTLGSEEGCHDRNSVYVNMCSFFAGEKTEKNLKDMSCQIYACAVQEELVGYCETVSYTRPLWRGKMRSPVK